MHLNHASNDTLRQPIKFPLRDLRALRGDQMAFFIKLARSLSAESLLPPSIRAISAWRAFLITSCKLENVRPCATSLVTTKCDEAVAATCGRCVMQIS